MSTPVDRAGSFKATIEEYGLKEMESGSVAISLKAKLTDFWDGQQWHDWREYEQEAEGDVWVVKKDGTPNEKAIETLVKFAGWDGDFLSVIQGQWAPTPCQLTIKAEDYQNRTRLKIAFVNDLNRTPGGQMSNVDEAKAKELQSRFGASMRAIVGNAKRAGSIPAPPPKTNGKTPLPPRAQETPDPGAAPLPARVGSGDDIPF
jgi:hypothetical protein